MKEQWTGAPLSSNIRPWLGEYEGRAQEAIEKSVELLRSGLALLSTIEIHPTSQRQVVVASLWARCIEHYEAIVLLCRHGINVPGEVVLRAMVEALLTSTAVAKDDEVLDLYIKEDLVARRKLARKVRKVQNPRLQSHVDPELEAELDRKIKETGARLLKTEFLAERAQLGDLYHMVYPVLSGTVHAKVRDLERYMTSKQPETVQFSFQRSDAELLGTLSIAGITFLLASDCVDAVFHQSLEQDRDSLLAFFSKLGELAGELLDRKGV